MAQQPDFYTPDESTLPVDGLDGTYWHNALCSVLYALCPMLYALCSI